MQSTFEKLGGTYRQEGDYLLPNIEAPESPQIGIWGQRRLQYLRTNKNPTNPTLRKLEIISRNWMNFYVRCR